MAVLVPPQPGQITSVDGHMIAYWSRVPMHKGTITMLGRIMAGSHAVIAHDETGQAVFVADYPPDIPLSQVIVTYCQQVAAATGSRVFVIDRAVNAVALARACTAQGLGGVCLLDDNAHRGRASFEATLGYITEAQHWGNVARGLGLLESDIPRLRATFFAGDRIDWEIVDFLRGLRATHKTGLISNAWDGLRP